MRKLIVQHWISLDGYATDRNGKLDFFANSVREMYRDEYLKTFLDGIDCILFGKNTYHQFEELWPDKSTDEELARKINTTQKIVFSKSLTHAPWGKLEPGLVDTRDPSIGIRELKSLRRKDIVIWGSISLTQLAMREHLVDEYHLFICPMITGGGKRLFPEGLIGTPLTLIHSNRHDNGIMTLQYRVQTSV